MNPRNSEPNIATWTERVILVLTALLLMAIFLSSVGCEAYRKSVGSRSVQAGYSDGKATFRYSVTYR